MLKTYKAGTSTIDNLASLCRLTPIQFVKQSYLIDPIRTDLNNHNQDLLKLVLVKSHTLAGFKGEIDNLTKQDVSNLILNRFDNLSVVEIYKAFENERFGLYESKSNGYNYFGADYVSEILQKYEAWKLELKQKHNITRESVIPVQNQLPAISESQKTDIMNQAIERLFEEYKSNQSFLPPFSHVFQELVERGVIPYPNEKSSPKLKEWYSEKRRLAQKLVEKEIKDEISNPERTQNRAFLQQILSQVKQSEHEKIELKLQQIVLEGVFQKRINENKSIEDWLK